MKTQIIFIPSLCSYTDSEVVRCSERHLSEKFGKDSFEDFFREIESITNDLAAIFEQWVGIMDYRISMKSLGGFMDESGDIYCMVEADGELSNEARDEIKFVLSNPNNFNGANFFRSYDLHFLGDPAFDLN